MKELASKIYLIGMPASGKSTLGKQLAQELGYTFIDLDESIVKAEQRSISDIFSWKGESYFRIVEQQVLHKTMYLKKAVIATGGGVPCFYDNISWINSNGLSIFLDVPVELLAERILFQQNVRPLFREQNREALITQLKEKLAIRYSFYQQAHICVKASSLNVKQLIYFIEHFK
jgi:shikimate kinase